MDRYSVAAVIAAMLFAAPVWALNESFLKDAPVSRLSEEEFKAYWGFVMKTLDGTPDGNTVQWKASKTTFTSDISLRRTFDEGGLKCREASIASDSGDRQMRGVYQFCKKGKDWKFRSPPQATK
jgi:surface antigen